MPTTETISDCDSAVSERGYAPADAVRADGQAGIGVGGTTLGSLTVPGHARHMAEVRAFVARTVAGRLACASDAVLLVSELAANSVRHSRSGREDGTITVTLIATSGGLRAEVADAGGAGIPALRRDQADEPELAEAGRGLQLVDRLSARWGCRSAGAGVMTWFELDETQP